FRSGLSTRRQFPGGHATGGRFLVHQDARAGLSALLLFRVPARLQSVGLGGSNELGRHGADSGLAGSSNPHGLAAPVRRASPQAATPTRPPISLALFKRDGCWFGLSV